MLPAAVFSRKVSFLFRGARAAAGWPPPRRLSAESRAGPGPPAWQRRPPRSKPGLGLRLAASKAKCGSSPHLAMAGQAPSRDSGPGVAAGRRLGRASVFPPKTMALFCKHRTASFVFCELLIESFQGNFNYPNLIKAVLGHICSVERGCREQSDATRNVMIRGLFSSFSLAVA